MDVAYPVDVCTFLAFRDLRIVDEKNGTGDGDALAFRAGLSYPVGKKSTPLIGVGLGPNFIFWTFKKSIKGGFFLATSWGGVTRAAI